MQNNLNNPTGTSSLKTTFSENSPRNVHGQFVVAPIVKANRNAGFICKCFYIEVLIKELEIDPDNASNNSGTYNMHDNRQSEYFQKTSNLKLVKTKKFCQVYTGSLSCANPSKIRFIIESPISSMILHEKYPYSEFFWSVFPCIRTEYSVHMRENTDQKNSEYGHFSCSVKPLTKSITSVFQVMYHIVRNHSNKCRYFYGVNNFCTISKNKAVITKVKNLNKRGESIMTFDFSTLYNKIPLNKLLQILYEMIDFCFNGRSQISL